MVEQLTCFKSYDVRGILGENFDEKICFRIARGFAQKFGAKKVVLGFDSRETSVTLAHSISQGLQSQGVTVLNIGLCGTEEMYHATSYFSACGGIQVTASHNPINYNGLKMVKKMSQPLDPETDLFEVKSIAEKNIFKDSRSPGSFIDVSKEARLNYVDKVLSFVNFKKFTNKKILVNCGNGTAGPTFDAIAKKLESHTDALTFLRMHHDPDSSFPNGIPNPLLEENRPVTKTGVLEAKADFGIAFDGDFDRCFFFDDQGNFVSGEYIVGLLAEFFLIKEPNARIVHDPRLIYNSKDIILSNGGIAIKSKTGHAFLKQAMRKKNAVYGGEISAHHYFRDFFFCDSGMIPWLLVIELLSVKKQTLSELINGRKKKFPSSGELNFKTSNSRKLFEKIHSQYENSVKCVDIVDGISFSFDNWRFNLRISNTEPLVRLNVETRGNQELLDNKVRELVRIIKLN